MRITHVINSLDPAGGGPVTVALGMCPTLAKLGHEVSIICFEQPQRQNIIRQSICSRADMSQVDIRFLPRPSLTKQIFSTALCDLLAPHLCEAQVIHLHGVWDAIVAAAGQFAIQQNIPYCITPHGMLDPWSLKKRALKKQLALAWRYRKILDGARFLHATSYTEAAGFKRINMRAPTRVVRLGIAEADKSSPVTPGGFYAQFPRLQGKPYVLFFGRIHHKKGLDYLAHAFTIISRRDSELQLVLVGPDDGALKPFLQQISHAGLMNRVHVVGPLWGEQRLAAMADAFCFCLPSRQENFGLVVLEAMLAGTPVVISDQVQLCDDLVAHQAGIVLPLDAQRFAKAILDLRENPAQRARMVRVARDLIPRRYRWSAIVHEWQTFYREIVQSPVFDARKTSAAMLGAGV